MEVHLKKSIDLTSSKMDTLYFSIHFSLEIQYLSYYSGDVMNGSRFP